MKIAPSVLAFAALCLVFFHGICEAIVIKIEISDEKDQRIEESRVILTGRLKNMQSSVVPSRTKPGKYELRFEGKDAWRTNLKRMQDENYLSHLWQETAVEFLDSDPASQAAGQPSFSASRASQFRAKAAGSAAPLSRTLAVGGDQAFDNSKSWSDVEAPVAASGGGPRAAAAPSATSRRRRKSPPKPPPLPQGTMTVEQLAPILFGEGGGFRPNLKNPNGSATGRNSVANYDPDSLEQLRQARRAMALIADKRHGRGVAPPITPSDVELRNSQTNFSWEEAKAAAKKAKTDVVLAKSFQTPKGDCRHFVMWPSNDGKRPTANPSMAGSWPYTQIDKITYIYGPYSNPVKTGDVPKGDNIYTFVYCGVP